MDKLYEQAAAFGRMWMDFAMDMTKAGMSYQPSSPFPQAARQTRNDAFQAMAEFYDGLLRSPFMLEYMKQSMDAAVAFRKQFNDAMTNLRHETQGVASEDVDNLMRTMGHLEERILDRLDEISARLDRVTRRLDGLEAGEAQGNGHSGALRGERTPISGSKSQRSGAEDD